MKKILPTLFILLVLGVCAAAVYLFEKPGHGGGAEATAAVTYLPGDTLALLSIPDLGHTQGNWKTTDLYKIWSEPEVQAFLEKPLSTIPPHPQFDDAMAQVAQLDPKNAFIALTSLDEKTNSPHLIGGFQFKGPSTGVDHLLAPLKDSTRKSQPAGKADLVSYQGHSIETFDEGDGETIASVYLNDWYLVSNDTALLKSTIDRFEHKAPAGATSLDKDADFAAVLAKLPSAPDTLIFARLKLMDKVYDLAAASGQPTDPAQREQIDKMKAFGATTRIENGRFRDTFYLLAPGLPPELAKLQMSALPLASMNTLLFASGMLNLPEHFTAPGGGAANPFAMLQGLGEMLSAHGVTYESFRSAFGNEASFQIDWPSANSQPSVIASINVKDKAAAGKFVDNFTNALSAEAAWQTAQANGLTFHTMAVPNVTFLGPTITVTDKHLLFGLNAPEVREAAARELVSTPNFTSTEAYKGAEKQVEKANSSFAYLDSKTFFERIYGTLKPMAMIGMSLAFPQAGEYVDLSKLPSTEAISRHLSPTILSSTNDGQGALMESVGSFTFGQALLGFAEGAGVVAVPIIQKQYGHMGAASPGSMPTPDPDDTPAPTAPTMTPDASPSTSP